MKLHHVLSIAMSIIVIASVSNVEAGDGPTARVMYSPIGINAWNIHLELQPGEQEWRGALLDNLRDEVEGRNDLTHVLARISGMGFLVDVGRPRLPVYYATLRIPTGFRVSTVTAAPNAGTDLVVLKDVMLAPAADAWAEYPNEPRPPRIPEANFYATDVAWPIQWAERGRESAVRGYRTLVVKMFPLRYNASRRELTIAPKLTANVTLERALADAGQPAPKPNTAYAAIFERSMQNLARGPADKEVVDFPVPRYDRSESPEAESSGCDYLAFVPDDREEELDRLLKPKRERMRVRTVLLSEFTDSAGEQLTGDALRNAIKERIEAEYQSDLPPTYILLVGDADDIPPYTRSTHPYWGYNWKPHARKVATDLYYTTMDGPNDLVADVLLGRLPAEDSDELKVMVDKILRFEKTLPETFSPGGWGGVLVSGEYQNSVYTRSSDSQQVCAAERWFLQTSNDIRQYLGLNGYSVTEVFVAQNRGILNLERYFYDVATPLPDDLEFAEPGTGTSAGAEAVRQIRDTWIDNTRLVLHRDHGSYEGWATPPFNIARVSDLPPLTGRKFAPVVYSLNCETGFFDHPHTECFAEQLMRNPSGASAVIAATRVSYSGHNDRLAEGLMAGVWPEFSLTFDPNTPRLDTDDEKRLGAILVEAKEHMGSFYPNNSITTLEYELFHLFGDPEMRVLGTNLNDSE